MAPSPVVAGGVACAVITIISIILIVVSFQTLDPNEVGFDLDTNIGQIVGSDVKEGGRYFLGLGHKFIVFPRTAQNIALNGIVLRSSDGLPISMDISLQYLLPVTDAVALRKVYNYFEEDYEKAMEQLIDGLVRDSAANFTSYQFFENRTLLSTAIESDMRNLFMSTVSISIEAFQIININLPTDFSLEIENTAVAVQDSISAQGERSVAEVQLQTRNGTVHADIEIANLNRDTQVLNILQNANNTAESQKLLYSSEAAALGAVKDALNLNNDELLAYIFIKTLQNAQSNIRLSVGVNPKLITGN